MMVVWTVYAKYHYNHKTIESEMSYPSESVAIEQAGLFGPWVTVVILKEEGE